MSPNAREPVDPASRPLPAAATIVVAGLSAALVIAGGVLIAERLAPRRSAAPLAAMPLPSMSPPVEESGRAAAAIVSAPTSAVTAPIASAATVATAAPIVSAPTIATAAPVAAEGGDPAGLPADRGYLVLGGVAGARAFVNGGEVGAAEQRIAVPCGARYVRLGTIAEKGKPPTWVTAGRSVVVGCRAETRVELTP
ncbi:MAG: hypothetical protein ABJE95_21280 [Byssovorax sp.]